MLDNYSVRIEEFAERHYIKSFEKKYKAHWGVTLKAIIAALERIDSLLNTDKANFVCGNDLVKLVKVEFRVVATKESAKSSGNRCIVAWHIEKRYVSILFVYGKTDLSGHNETAEWKNIIKENYPEYEDILNLN